MKDWMKIAASILAAVIMGLIGFSVHLSLDSIRRDIDRIEEDCEKLRCEHKADIMILHKRIAGECP